MGQVPEEYILNQLKRIKDGDSDLLKDLLARIAALEALVKDNFQFVAGKWVMPSIGGLEDRLFRTRDLSQENLLEKIRLERLQRNTETDRLNDIVVEETAARIQGDTNLSSEIFTEQAARILADNSIITSVTNEIVARQAGDDVLTASIASEESARIAADGTISATITSEVAARQAADDALQATLEAQVDEERDARILGDGTVQASLDLEITARINAVADEATARENADNSLTAQISTEAVARANADGTLGAEYVLSVTTYGNGQRSVTGFRVTNYGGGGNGTEFVVQADRFAIVHDNGVGVTVPFLVQDGIVYIDTARIRDLTVGTLKLAPNAATLLGSSDAGSVSGNGAWQQLTSVVVPADYDMEVFVMATLQQDFSAGARTFEIEIRENGTPIAYTQGSSISQYPILQKTRSLTPASHTYSLWWKGQDANIAASSSTLTAFGRYK